MTTQTMTEKDHYLATFEREFEITMRLFRDYPADKLDLKPAEKLRTAREVMWVQAMERAVTQRVVGSDKLEPGSPLAAPDTLDAILAGITATQREAAAKIKAMDPSAMNEMITMPVGPKQTAPVRRGDALWMFLYDGIHHRGQMSVYQRIAGGKVRSIYGPTADETWW